MPFASVRGITLKYEIIGSEGPWVCLATGGRSPYNEFVPLAQRIAGQGFRVLLHDRRNCGGSEVAIDVSMPEDEHRIADWHALKQQLGIGRAFMGGSSSGCRMSLLYYKRHPAEVAGLLLFRVTGGPWPAQRLPENYFNQFIRAAEQGGIEAVCDMDHWKACIEARPENRAKLMSMGRDGFIRAMTQWRDEFLKGIDLPAVGVSKDDLSAIDVPTIVIPGNDRIHSEASGRLVHSLIPRATLHVLPLTPSDEEIVWFHEWAPHYDEMARVLVEHMRRAG